MNKYLYLSVIAAFLMSCGAKQEPTGSIEKLKMQRDSLRELKADISKQLEEISFQIAQADTSKTDRVMLVNTKVLSHEKFAHFIEVQGAVESDQNVVLTPEMPAMVKKILVEEGQEVSAGQQLVILDTDMIQKNIAEVKTSYELAKTVFEKQKRLWDQKIGSEVQYLQAKANKESLEQRIAALNAQLDKAIMNAPFSGIVDEISFKEGEMASPGFSTVRLVNLKEMYILSDVSEKYLSSIRKNTSAQIYFPSLNLNIQANIAKTGNHINPNNRTFEVKVNFTNADGAVKPNQMAVLKIQDYVLDSALVVDSETIQQDAKGDNFLFVVSDDKKTAKKTKIKIGGSFEGKTVVTEGLKPGDEVITLGGRTVRDGDFIEIKTKA